MHALMVLCVHVLHNAAVPTVPLHIARAVLIDENACTLILYSLHTYKEVCVHVYISSAIEFQSHDSELNLKP